MKVAHLRVLSHCVAILLTGSESHGKMQFYRTLPREGIYTNLTFITPTRRPPGGLAVAYLLACSKRRSSLLPRSTALSSAV